MSLTGKIAAFLPVIHMALILVSLFHFLRDAEILAFVLLLFCIYLYPLLLWRLLNFLAPLQEGESNILERQYSPWWFSHQIQLVFIALPALEGVLKLIPGAYSLWLRAWGSRIGKNVYWTPGVIVYDRSLIEIGNGVIVGERAIFVSHVISPKNSAGILLIKKIQVEDGAFIGAGSVLSPGCQIKAGVLVRAGTEFYPESVMSSEGLIKGKIRGVQ